MKNFISLLFTLFCFNLIGQEKPLYQITEKIDSCQLDIESAERDSKLNRYYINNKSPFLKCGDDLPFSIYFNNYLKKKFNIWVIYFGSDIEQNHKCYKEEMTKIINRKFGVDFFEKNKIEANKQYKIDIQTQIDTGFVFSYADSLPKFREGQDSLYRFLGKNISYPFSCLKNDTTTQLVYCQLVFEKDGTISSTKIMMSPNTCFSNEVIRVMELMPKWKPAIINDQKIRFTLMIPVNFEKK